MVPEIEAFTVYVCGWIEVAIQATVHEIGSSIDTIYYSVYGSSCWLAIVVYQDALLQKLLQ